MPTTPTASFSDINLEFQAEELLLAARPAHPCAVVDQRR